MVDFLANGGAAFGKQPGCFVQEHDADRWRVLLDLRRASLDGIQRLGATQISDSPVTLEDVFVALGRD